MIEIIPAIDLLDGKCVRLEQGDFDRRTEYSDDPVAVARDFEAAGIKRLHMVDLDGARGGKVKNLRVLASVSANTDLMIDFGGGIATDDDVEAVFDAGATFASVGSVAVRNPDKFTAWLERFGPERFMLGADVRGRSLSINGWQTNTDTEITHFLSEYSAKKVQDVFVTDIAKDGQLRGPSTGLYEDILSAIPELRLIASGGVGSLGDIHELQRIGCQGVIVGKAIYEGRISLSDLAAVAKSQ